MKNYTSNYVTVTLPDHISIGELAGKLPADQLSRMAKPYKRNVGVVCKQLADIVDATPEFTAPTGIANELRQIGNQAEDMNRYIADLENVLKAFRQQHFLYNHQAYKLVRHINNLVNAQTLLYPMLEDKFAPLIYYFNKKRTNQTPSADISDMVDPKVKA